MAQIRVLVADSQLLFAEALGEALGRRDFLVADEHPTAGPQVLEAIARDTPDVVLLDYWMTGIEGPAITALSMARIQVSKSFCSPGFTVTGKLNEHSAAERLASCRRASPSPM